MIDADAALALMANYASPPPTAKSRGTICRQRNTCFGSLTALVEGSSRYPASERAPRGGREGNGQALRREGPPSLRWPGSAGRARKLRTGLSVETVPLPQRSERPALHRPTAHPPSEVVVGAFRASQSQWPFPVPAPGGMPTKLTKGGIAPGRRPVLLVAGADQVPTGPSAFADREPCCPESTPC